MSNDNPTDPRQIILEDGRELVLDINRITWGEVRELARIAIQTHENVEDAEARYCDLLGKPVGLSGEEIQALGYADFRQIEGRLNGFIRNPLKTDPN